mmetsp:Transcript_18503/g.31784  ORF Transcript_18503/g.31784 Transcript_18503/m.31784 type:complete len:103 (-) Transcript_18503:164-472(-)
MCRREQIDLQKTTDLDVATPFNQSLRTRRGFSKQYIIQLCTTATRPYMAEIDEKQYLALLHYTFLLVVWPVVSRYYTPLCLVCFVKMLNRNEFRFAKKSTVL